MSDSRIVIAASALSLFGCGATYRFTQASAVPAAQGQVRVMRGPNGNTRVAVRVKHLAEPARVDSGAATYVVWARSGEGAERVVSSLGALKVDKDLDGKLYSVTPLANFDLFITPEASATATSPTGPEVLSLHVYPK